MFGLGSGPDSRQRSLQASGSRSHGPSHGRSSRNDNYIGKDKREEFAKICSQEVAFFDVLFHDDFSRKN